MLFIDKGLITGMAFYFSFLYYYKMSKILKQAIYNKYLEDIQNQLAKQNKKQINELEEMKKNVNEQIKEKKYGLKKFDIQTKLYLKHHTRSFLVKLRIKEVDNIKKLYDKLDKINGLIYMFKKNTNVDEMMDLLNSIKDMKVSYGSKKTSRRQKKY